MNYCSGRYWQAAFVPVAASQFYKRIDLTAIRKALEIASTSGFPAMRIKRSALFRFASGKLSQLPLQSNSKDKSLVFHTSAS